MRTSRGTVPCASAASGRRASSRARSPRLLQQVAEAPPPVRPDQPPPAEPGMIPLTIPEIKRLLAALTTRPLPRWLVIHWDAWTRRHQARSRWFHKRTRLTRDAEIALVS